MQKVRDKYGKDYWAGKNREFLYGLSHEDFLEMLDAQAGLCAICTEPMSPGKFTHVDHCHATGRVRGLLCSNCNVTLGHMRDQPLLLEGAVEYLNHFGVL